MILSNNNKCNSDNNYQIRRAPYAKLQRRWYIYHQSTSEIGDVTWVPCAHQCQWCGCTMVSAI